MLYIFVIITRFQKTLQFMMIYKHNKCSKNKNMSKKLEDRPVFPFTSIVGQEEICDLNYNISKSRVE